METRANYVAIGAFVFVVLIGAFLFILWLGGGAERVQRSDIRVVFPGAVTGLSIGGQVLYNGIRIGDVAALNFDPNDPKVVIATVRVDANAPLREDVTATLNFQGLTGVAYVELFGGTPSAPPLFKEGASESPVIYAERSAYDDIVEGARNVLKRADATLATIEHVVASNEDEIDRTIKNIQTFSDALARNSAGIETFMRSISVTGEALTDLSGRLRGLVDRAETLLAAVPPEKVTQIVDNAADITEKASGAMDGLTALVDDARDAARQLETFSTGLNSSLNEINKIIAAVDTGAVRRIVTSIETVTTEVASKADSIGATIDDVRVTAATAREFADDLAAKKPDVDRIIADARQTMENLTTASVKVQGILDRADAMVEGQGEGLVAEATAAARSIRKVADVLSERIGPITDGLTKFTDRGSADFSAAMAQLNQTLIAIQRTVNNLDRNPSRVIFGGSDLPTYNGAQRR